MLAVCGIGAEKSREKKQGNFTVIFGFLMRAIRASTISLKLCGGMLVAIPTFGFEHTAKKQVVRMHSHVGAYMHKIV